MGIGSCGAVVLGIAAQPAAQPQITPAGRSASRPSSLRGRATESGRKRCPDTLLPARPALVQSASLATRISVRVHGKPPPPRQLPCVLILLRSRPCISAMPQSVVQEFLGYRAFIVGQRLASPERCKQSHIDLAVFLLLCRKNCAARQIRIAGHPLMMKSMMASLAEHSPRLTVRQILPAWPRHNVVQLQPAATTPRRPVTHRAPGVLLHVLFTA